MMTDKILSQNILSLAKKMIQGKIEDSLSCDTSVDIKIETVKYIVKNIMEVSPEDFYNIWSIDFLKKTKECSYLLKLVNHF